MRDIKLYTSSAQTHKSESRGRRQASAMARSLYLTGIRTPLSVRYLTTRRRSVEVLEKRKLECLRRVRLAGRAGPGWTGRRHELASPIAGSCWCRYDDVTDYIVARWWLKTWTCANRCNATIKRYASLAPAVCWSSLCRIVNMASELTLFRAVW